MMMMMMMMVVVVLMIMILITMEFHATNLSNQDPLALIRQLPSRFHR
uniref:Uncharacterized protein LOC105647950 isoform X2 n=1 Tax=Rhizophora mucronata TaxID=61149 RepID=A0A2P2LDU0_RHIMU